MKKKLFLLLLGLPLTAAAQVFQIKGTHELVLPDSDSHVAAMSPKGDFLLLTDGENKGLRKYDISTGRTTTLSDAGGAGYGVEISADGSSALFRETTFDSGHLRYTTLKLADLASGRSENIVKASRQLQGYSLNGGRISTTEGGLSRARIIGKATTVASSRPALSISNGQLMMSRGTRAEVFSPLGQDKSYIWPSLSPSGEKVLFYVAGDGAYVCSTDGSNVVSLGIIRAPKWYDDSTVVGMRDEDDGVTVQSSAVIASDLSGHTQVLSPSSVIAMYPQVAPEAGQISYSTPEGKTYIIEVGK